MTPLHPFLLDALLQPADEARASWMEWRRLANLDRLDSVSFLLLPSLSSRLEKWLDGDPEREIFMGICRRGWSQTQLRRKMLTEAIAVLSAAGVPATAAGPAAWADRYWPRGVVRSLDRLEVDLAPLDVPAAVAALTRAGWSVSGRVPRNWFWTRFAPPVLLKNRAGIALRLHWRALPSTDVVLPELSLKSRETRSEHDLVRVLGGEYGDGVHWQCDAAMILRSGELDWNTIASLFRWRSLAKTRLHELRPKDVPPVGIEERLLGLPLRTVRRLRST